MPLKKYAKQDFFSNAIHKYHNPAFCTTEDRHKSFSQMLLYEYYPNKFPALSKTVCAMKGEE
jgi:hypothetical protein